MAVSVKRAKKPKVVIEEFKSDQSDEGDQSDEVPAGEEEHGDDMVKIKEESDEVLEGEEEPGDDMVEIKAEVEEPDKEDVMYDTSGLGLGDIDIKEEDVDEDITSGDISEDSDIKMEEDSETESPNSKKKESNSVSKQKVEKRVKLMVDSSDETETDSEEEDEFEDPETKNEADTEDTKSGLADVMAQILAGDNRPILSKAKKDYMPVKNQDVGEFEFVDVDGNVKSDVKIKVEDEVNPKEKIRQKQLEKEKLTKVFKLKPSIEIDREKERKLRVIATQGVVQLFTAIEKHKAIVRKKKSETKSVVAREELSSRAFNATFLDLLDEEGEKLKRSHSGKLVKKEIKEEEEIKDEPIDLAPATKKPRWNVFADNFYKEPTLQGWDAKSDDED